MNRQLTNLVLMIGSACACAGGLKAQSFRVQATIPFEFEVNGKTKEPGTYLVERMSTTPVLLLRNRMDTNTVLLGMASPTEVNKGTARLTFHRYGNRTFLAEIWNSEYTGTKLPESRREKEIRSAAKYQSAASITVPCRPETMGL